MLSGFSAQSREDGGEVERLIVCQTCVGSWVLNVVICSTERVTRGDQRQKLYADAQRNMLELVVEQLTGSTTVLVQH